MLKKVYFNQVKIHDQLKLQFILYFTFYVKDIQKNEFDYFQYLT